MEKHMLAIVNETRKIFDGPRLLHDLISTSRADSTAIDFLLSDDTRVSLTYDSFKAASLLLTLRIYRLLRRRRAERHIVPVLIPQSPELYIAWQAILQAGACVCPVQHDVPPERLKFIINDVSANIILCLEDQASRLKSILPDTDCIVVSLEDLNHADQDHRLEGLCPSINIRPSDPAYVMYTSGSTGIPKGVIVSHSSITQSLLAHEQHIPRFKRFLQFASPTFDVFLFEIFFPFMRGETLVSSSRERMLADLPGTIITLDADAAELTPTVAGTLLRTRDAAPCLQTLLTIGEMLTKRVVEEFGGSLSRESMLYAMYGPTEAAVHCTIASKLLAFSSVRNIGKPLDTVTAFILKESAQSKPPEIALVGESGELAIAGQLADGYLNRTDETKTSFIMLPGYGQVYRTGDRARCHSDGTFEIIGRISDGQVKLRGQRVELGEIGEVASGTNGVSMAAAIVIDDQLVLFYESQTRTPADEVQSTCKSWLPPFMRPGEVIMLTEGVPRLPSGKVDKKALERGHKEKTIQSASPTEFWEHDIERMLAVRFEEVLGRTIARHSDLWSCGLDSLRAISIAARLRPHFPKIRIHDILAYESIADLAAQLKAQGQAQAHQAEDVAEPQTSQIDDWSAITRVAMERLSAPPESLEKITPCSSMQIAMLIETSAKPDLNFTHITLKTASDVSVEDLWNAMCRLATGNEILRSGFFYTGLSSMPWVQVVWKCLEKHNLSMLHPLQLVTKHDANRQLPVLRLHHALYDGWSWELILDDLNTILANQSLPTRPSFEDFASWQRQRSRTNAACNSQYWKRLLTDHVRTTLPSLTSSRDLKAFREAVTQSLGLPHSKLSDLCAGLRISQQTLLQACWAIVLSAYTDSSDVVFGTVASGRHVALKGVDQLIGVCLSTLPTRVVLFTMRTTKDLLHYLQRQWLESLEHSSSSLHEILKMVDGADGGSLFDSLLVWQEGDERSPSQRQHIWTGEIEDVLDYTTVLEIEPVLERLEAKLTVDTDKIPVTHANAMLQQLDHLLSRIASTTEADLYTLWHTGPESIMSVSNAKYTPQDYQGLTDTIQHLSKEDPSQTALRFVQDFDPSTGRIDVQVLSYGDLYECACNVSATLRSEHAIQPDNLVAIIAQKSVGLYLAIVGTIMSGAGYFCIDPSTPSKRVQSILQQAECAVILTDDSFDATEVHAQCQIVKIESVLHPRTEDCGQPPSPTLEDLAYAVFTSGTTGVPKGVLITRKNLLSNISCLSKIYPCEPTTDSLLQACSPAFDVSVFEIFWTWHMGMTLCAATSDVLFRDIESLIDRLGVTHLSMTPSVAALVNPENVPKVKMLVTAGEPMNTKVFQSWGSDGRLYQGYGPSETTNICNVRPNVAAADHQSNVGPAFPNTSVFVCVRSATRLGLNQSQYQAMAVDDFRLLPKGAIGEIWIGGEQVGRGYTNEALTAQSFLQHPSYGRLYRSGDIGRLLSDDSLVILGRTDDQAKIRGQRIELGEINGVLLQRDVVQDAVTFIHSKNGSSRLLSFCAVPKHEETKPFQETVGELFGTLECHLPTYMIPDALILVDEIPLTKQGKVHREELLEKLHVQDSARSTVFFRQQLETSDLMDLNGEELEVARALSEAAGIEMDAVQRNTSFYALGLNSINAIRLGQLLLDRGFGRLDVSTILKHASIKALMPFVQGEERYRIQQRQNEQLSSGRLFAPDWLQRISKRLKLQSILPCTDLQLSMLSISEDANSQAYQNKLRFSVKGEVERLKHAWTEAVIRHDLLKCVFVRCPDSATPYAQVVLQEPGLHWSNGEMKLEVPELDEIVPITPFRITTHPMNEKYDELKVEMHHALYDAEAMSSLLRGVESLYRKQQLPPPASFESYIKYKSSLDSDELQGFWQRTLTGVVPCILADRIPNKDAAKKHDADHASTTLILTLEMLESMAYRQEASVLSVLQCALARLIFCVFDRQDVCFGNVFSGRNLPIDGIDCIFGPCFNTLPIRAQAKRSTSNHQLVGALHELNLQILPLQPSSLRQIQRLCNPEGRPLFDVLLLLQQEQPKLDASIWELLEDRGDMSFPFILEVNQDRQRNEVRATLHSEVAQEEILESILGCFDDLLQHSVAYPQALAMDFSCIQSSLHLQELKVESPQRSLVPYSQVSGRSPAESWSYEETRVRDIMVGLSPFKAPNVSKQSSLFKLGLDSLNAVQMATKLRKLGYRISSSDILEAPTIFDIAARCVATSVATETEVTGFDFKAFDLRCRSNLCQSQGLEGSAIQSIRPCTATLSGIITQYLRSNNQLYFNTIRLRLARDIDLVRLRKSWEIAMQRHEMLRTGFAESNMDGYSFVMITYHLDAMHLPWEVGSTQMSNSERLSMPRWRLRLSFENEVAYLDLSMLHALYDAQSIDMILGEVANRYLGEELPKITDIAPTISSILSQSDSEDAKLFWQEGNNAIQSTKFPDLNIYRAQWRPPSVLTKKVSMPLRNLQNNAARLSCSLQSICQAAWAKLLAAYTGQDRVTFGLILSGRNFDDSRDQAAFPCINTVPCSVDVGNGTANLVLRISSLNSKLSRFQHTPLTSIKRWQQLEAEPFDTILILQKFTSTLGTDAPWTIVEDMASAEYAVSIEVLVDEERNEVVIRATYSEHVLPTNAAELVLSQLDDLINEIVNRERYPSTTQDLSIRRPKHDLLPSSLQFLHEMVERTADCKPHAPALEFVGDFSGTEVIMHTWSYADLDTEANRIAHLLIQHGAKVGDLVAVCFDKCPQASFAILGVLKAGCAYVAIDPGAPVDRKKFILQDCGGQIVLTTKDKMMDFVTMDDLNVIDVTDLAAYGHITTERPSPTTPLDPQDTCYCLYTSGTTGQPKGCLISHRNAVQAMLSFERIFHGHWSSESRWLQFASFHFDVSVLEQYWSWYVGICVTSAPRDLLFEDIPGFIRRMKITHLDLTPSLARLLTPENVPSLCDGVFVVGGEQVSQDIIDIWGGANCLYNFYGPSEVTIGCTVRPRVAKNTKPTNIGQQWDNVGTYVLEPGTEKPVVRGGVGELCLSGLLVGKGYLNRPELTAKSFVTLKSDGTRVYRTGDLVRFLHDNSFEFLGRMDDQVKLRGQRLEIGEINQVIRNSSSDVKGVATIVTKHPVQGKEQLVAFVSTSDTGRQHNTADVVPTTEARTMCSNIRGHCMDVLPRYMIPSLFLMLTSVPLTVNNKIDKKRLQQLYNGSFDTSATEAAVVAARREGSESFQAIAEILADWFSTPRDQIVPTSSLVELGLDSISAIGLSRKLRAHGFAQSTATTVMRNTTIADLVESLAASHDTTPKLEHTIETSKQAIAAFESTHRETIAKALQVHSVDIEAVAPCTPLQEGMISKVISSEAGDSVYFAQFHYDLKENVDPEKITHAWRVVQESTSILRTYFVATAEGFAQAVLKKPCKAAGVERQHVSWTNNAFVEWIETARSLGKNLPWRVALSPTWGKTYMTLFIFHGLYDGISLPLLLDKVAQAYTSAGNDNLTSQFYKILPYGPLRMEPGAQEFWCSRLPFVRRLNLQAKYAPRQPHQLVRRSIRTRLSLTDLHDQCIRLKITSSALFQAAWLLCLEETYGVNPSLGIVVSGRSIQHDDAETVAGPMFSTIPCAIAGLPDDADLGALAKACHRFVVDMLPFQHTALRDIAKWVGNPRNSLFDNLFVHQKESEGYKHDLWKRTASEAVPDYPLNLEVEQKLDGSFVLTLVAKQEYLNTTDEYALLSRLRGLLERAANGERVALPETFKTTGPANEAVREGTFTEQSLADPETDMLQAAPFAMTVRKQFADLSGLEKNKIGLTRPSLFELGLDSIDVMKLATRLRNDGLTIPVSTIMQMPTVGGICRVLEESQVPIQGEQRNSPKSTNFEAQQDHYRDLLSSQSVELRGVERVLPVTPMQEGLLLDYERYYHVMAFEMDLDVNIQRLERAWTLVIQRQPILRTKFVAVENSADRDAFVQVVHSPTRSTAGASGDDMRDETPVEAADRIRSLAGKGGTSAETIQIRFVKSQSQHFMLLGMPHAAYDAWSLDLLHQQVSKAYVERQNDVEEDAAIPYEVHLATTLLNASSDESRSFWQEILRNVRPSIFQSIIAEVSDPTPQFIRRKANISLSSALALCKNVGVTMQSLGLACWTLTLAHYTRTLDVCFGLVLSGRTTEGADFLIYPTFSIVLFTSQLVGSETLEDFLRKLHKTAIRVSEHQHLPLREASKLAGGSNGPSGLFNTLFTYQKVPQTDGGVRKLYHEIDLDDGPRNPPYAVNVEMEGRDNSLWWTIATQEGFMDEAGAETVLATIEHVLEAFLERSQSPVLEEKDGKPSICGRTPITLEPWSKQSPTFDDQESDVTDEENWTDVEAGIRHVLAEVSKTALVDVKKSTGFYNLGLDSISAIKVAGLLKKQGLKVPVSKIIEQQTVRNMASVARMIFEEGPEMKLAQEQPLEDGVSRYADTLDRYCVARNDVESVHPTTVGQSYMLDMWAKSRGKLFYPSFWLIVETVTRREFDQAMTSLTINNPMLRTTFVNDITNSEASLVQVTFNSEAAQRYPLPWSYAVEEHDEKLLVTLKLHHALYDAVSLQIMITELERLCQADRTHQQERLDTEINSFLSLTHRLDAGTKDQQQRFWTSYLQIPSVALAQGSFNAPRVERFNPQLFQTFKLDNVLMREGLSIQSLFFAICGSLFARFKSSIGQLQEVDHVVIGIYLANRSLDIPDLPSLAVPTFNIVPLKVSVSGRSGLLQAAKEVQDDLVRISRAENCGVSLREVYGWTGKRLDFVVNFLKVPGMLDDEKLGDEEQDVEDGKARVRHADEDIKTKMKLVMQVGEAASPFFDNTKPLVSELEWCVPSIDVEAKVEEGWLGVGVFAPEDMLREQAVDQMIDEIQEILESLEGVNRAA